MFNVWDFEKKISFMPQMAGVQSYELILVLLESISSFLRFDMTPFAGQTVYSLIIVWLKRNLEEVLSLLSACE